MTRDKFQRKQYFCEKDSVGGGGGGGRGGGGGGRCRNAQKHFIIETH